MRLVSVILPYAVSIRDFVHSGVLAQLLSLPNVAINIYTQNPDLPEFDHLRTNRVTLREIPSVKEGRTEGLLRRFYPILFADQFEFIRQNVSRNPRRRIMASAIVALRRLLGTRLALRLYGKLLLAFSARPMGNLLDGDADLVIGTRSLVNSLDYAFILEASRRGIPILIIASSWDNFTTKGFFPFPVERTVVWNRKMAEELVEIFGVAQDRIVIAGYPRIGLIRDTGQFTGPEDYLEALGLGRYRRFVLHTMSYSELTRPASGGAPLEYRLAREVAQALLPTLPDDTCLLVRLHPFSDMRDEAVLEGLEGMHVFVPGRQDRYVERVMSAADELHLACQLNFSECIVSMASTITIDALALQRPIVNLIYDPTVHAGAAVIPRFYEYNHFRDLLDRVAPPLARTTAETVAFVRACLAERTGSTADLAAFERDYVPADSDRYAQAVAATVEALLEKAVPKPGSGAR